uniref:DUF7507 domain-containing protein n=1 Tax=Algoriphagus mannitolivorans TaxID=226504 RepID=UPI0004797F84
MVQLSDCRQTQRSEVLGFLKWRGLFKENLFSFSLIFLLFLFFTPKGFGQNTAPVTIPTGGFRIEGDLISNSPSVGIGDWFAGPTGAGGHVFLSNGTALDPETSFWSRDGYKGSSLIQERIFTQGTKSNDNPNSWVWGTGDAGGKGDLGNAFLHIGTSQQNDTWLVVGADRLVTNGTSYLEFEFFQNTVTRTINNGFTSAGPNGGRTVNDILVAISYTNGGSSVDIKFYLWKPVPGGFDYVQQSFSSSQAFGFVNTGSPAIPVGAFGNSVYQPLQFVEAALNISEILGDLTDPCLGIKIKTVMVKTRSSASLTAAADDFIDPFQVSINFGTAEVTYDSNLFCGPGRYVSPDIDGVQGGTFTVPTGLSIDPSTGVIDLNNSLPGTYNFNYNFTTKGCSKSVPVQVVIPQRAPTPNAATFDYCTNSGNKTPTITPAAGYTIKWYDQNDNPLSGAPTINTSAAGTFTFKISQTKTGECESAKATVTINVGACSLTLVKTATNGPTGGNCLDPTLTPTINYSFEVKNNGAYPLSNITVTDPLSGLSAITLQSGDTNNNNQLDVNETWTYTASYTIKPQDIQNGKVENQATATGQANGTTVSDLSGTAVDNNLKTVVVICQNPALSIDKTITSGSPYSQVGNVVSYSYKITNTGNVTLPGPFTVSDNKIASI